VTPARMIAPVGSEVVLMAGLLGEQGRFITRQPIEWMLSQDSVGQIVDVGDRDRCWYGSKKLSANFATTQTATRRAVITRGTPSVTDDVVQEKGQCWVSVTSASEGTSYVTVMATKGATWPQRRQTAAIYWVDAQWVFPMPQTVRAGQPHTLSTTVTRTATGAPVSNWIVRYEIAGGSPATFGQSGAAVAEVRTDGNGVASAILQPSSGDPGTTQVRIQVIRPPTASGDAPQTRIGEGYTSIGWSAPGLGLRATGPQTGAVDTTLVYRLEVSNPGDVVTAGVVVRDFIPPGLKFISSNPPAQIFGDRSEWRLGNLQPKSTRIIEVNCRADAGGVVRYRFAATSDSALQAEAHVDTQISRPSLVLDMSGPNTATVGQKIQFRVQITNKGDRPLENVTITDQFATGLEQTEGQPSPVQQTLGQLQPDETKVIGLSFFVRNTGELCHTVEVTATGGHFANTQSCVVAKEPEVVPQPQLRVQMTGPAEATAGQSVTFSTLVTNSGNVPIDNVRIANTFDAALEPKATSGGLDQDAYSTGQLVWTISQLQPGETAKRSVECLCRQTVAAASAQAVVTGLQVTSESTSAVIRILAPGAAALGAATGSLEGPTLATPGLAAAGQLGVTISAFKNPVFVGERATYLITIKNLQTTSDKDVVLTLQFPAGLEFEKLSGPVDGVNVSNDRRTVQVTPIRELRAHESLAPFKVEALGTAAGNQALSVRVTSQQAPQGVVAEEPITVLDKP